MAIVRIPKELKALHDAYRSETDRAKQDKLGNEYMEALAEYAKTAPLTARQEAALRIIVAWTEDDSKRPYHYDPKFEQTAFQLMDKGLVDGSTYAEPAAYARLARIAIPTDYVIDTSEFLFDA